jgi:glycerol-3-phosphate dehydrogenase
VFGGKITTARDIARQVVDQVTGELKVDARCRTADLPLWGGDLEGTVPEEGRVREALRAAGQPGEEAEDLVAGYGSRAREVLSLLGTSSEGAIERFAPVDAARLVYAVREEMAVTTADLLLRRTLIGYEAGQARDRAPGVARWLGSLLGRAESEIEADLSDYFCQADLLTP